METIIERAEIAKQDPQSLFEKEMDRTIRRARDGLLALQRPDGYSCFELEADYTIPAEYILARYGAPRQKKTV
jgi:hypothetical protein